MAQNVPGNVDLYAQPKVKNADGSISTVDSHSYNIDGKETLLPSVTPDGRHLTSDAAIVDEYRKTGRHLGKFDSVDAANKYAVQLHNDYASGKYEKKPMADNFDPSQLAALLQQHPELMQSLGQFNPSSAPISDNPDAPVQKPGFLQSIGNALSGNPMLQSAAHPKTAGDIASLLLPSGAMGAVAPARGIQAGIDGTKAVDTGAGIIAKVNQFGGDRSVRGVGGLHVEAPGGMSSITPGEWEKLQKAGGATDMPSALVDPREPSVGVPSAPSISLVDPAAAHRDLLIRLMQRQMGTGPNLQERFTQSNALETALAKERQAANMASRTR